MPSVSRKTLRRSTRKVLRDVHTNGREREKIAPMDALDREILAQLQQDGRLTATELASRVGLSLSAVTAA